MPRKKKTSIETTDTPTPVEPPAETSAILTKEEFCEREGLRPLSALGMQKYEVYLNNPEMYQFKGQ